MGVFEDLRNEIRKGKFKPVYLFFGQDPYLAKDLLKELEKACFPQGEAMDFNYDLFDGETVSIVSILEAALTLPVFAPMRLVVVKNAPWFNVKNKQTEVEDGEEKLEEAQDNGESFLLEYLNSPSPTTVLVFLAKDKVDKRRKIYREVAKKGVAWEGVYLKGLELRGFINERLVANGKRVDPIALATIIEFQQGDLEFLEKELGKLVSYVGERQIINLDDVENIFTFTDQNTIFDLLDAVGMKDTGKALWLLRKMFQEGETYQYISSMLVYQLRLIAQAKALFERNFNQQQIIDGIKGHPFPIKKAIAQSKNFTMKDLIFALEKLLEADVAIKVGQAEQKTILEQTVFELCS